MTHKITGLNLCMVLGALSRGSMTDRGTGVLRYGLGALVCRKISLPHAESIFNVLGKVLSGIVTGLCGPQGLDEDDCVWS